MSAARHEAKGDEFMQKAAARLKSWTIFSASKSAKFEDAGDLFTQAGNSFKLAKAWDRASVAYVNAGEAYLSAGSKHECAENFVSASSTLAKAGLNKRAAETLQRAVEYFQELGSFNIAGKKYMEIGGLWEKEQDMEKAVAAYSSSADIFDGEDTVAAANKAKIKVALLQGQREEFLAAAELFEEIGVACVDNSLLKWSAKEHFFHATLCHFALNDLIASSRAMQRYVNLHVPFEQSREFKLLEVIVTCMGEHDLQAYTNAMAEFDSFQPLDAWRTKILLKIRGLVEGSSSPAGDGEDSDEEDVC